MEIVWGIKTRKTLWFSYSPDPEFAGFIESGRVSGVADDEGAAVVVKAAIVRLDEDVRLLAEGRGHVEERALEASLAVVRGRLQHEFLVAKMSSYTKNRNSKVTLTDLV